LFNVFRGFLGFRPGNLVTLPKIQLKTVWQIGQTCKSLQDSRIRAQLTKALQITSQILENFGLGCIRVAPLRGHAGKVALTIADISARKSTGGRIWFRSQREADRVMAAMLGQCLDTKKTKYGMAAQMSVTDAIDQVRAISRSLGVTPIEDADLDVTFNMIAGRIEALIGKLPRRNRKRPFALDRTAHRLKRVIASESFTAEIARSFNRR
jgi:hypothetical protein